MIYSIKALPLYREVYTVKRVLYTYTVIKFDSLFNMESLYVLKALRNGNISCPCFQGKFGRCRHRPLTIMFDTEGRTNKGWFYDWEEKKWYLPIRMR